MTKPRRKVLVVDDDLTMLKLTEKILVNDGYMVYQASRAEVGLRLAVEEHPDLILLDVLLPDLNGKDLAHQLSENPLTADIPIVFMTITLPLGQDKGKETIEAGGRSYPAFAKPLHNRKTLSTIRKLINKKINKNL